MAKPCLLCQLKEMSARSGYEHEMSTRGHTHKYINIHTCVNTHTNKHTVVVRMRMASIGSYV